MLCAKFGWNCPCGSGEEDENVKSLQTDRWTDNRWLEKLIWAFSSGELKTEYKIHGKNAKPDIRINDWN